MTGIPEAAGSSRGDRAASIAVIILTLNQRDVTLRCLDSFRAVSEPAFRIVVWDNGSNDGTEQAVREQFPDVLIRRHPFNLGAAGGRNAAASLAIEAFSPSYLLFLDNDTVVTAGFLVALMSPFVRDQRLGEATPKLRLLRDPSRLDVAGGVRIRYWLLSSRTIGHGEIDRGQYDTPRDCVAGGCVLVRTQVFTEVGGFDPAFDPYGCEDIDFSVRVTKAGYRCLYVPEAVILHDPTQTFENGAYSENYVRHKVRNWHLFMNRHAPWWERAAFYTVGAPFILVRMIVREGRKGNLSVVRAGLQAARTLLR